MTPNSTLTPYATSQDLLIRQDVGLVGQLAVDNGQIATADEINDVNTVAGMNVYTALLSASGEVEYAATRGDRYQPADLAGLTGGSASFFKQIVCDIAMIYLYDRRDGQNPPENVEEKYKRAQKFMDQLVNGERVFGDSQNQSAGSAKTAFFTPADLIGNHLVSALYSRSFGHRSNQTIP